MANTVRRFDNMTAFIDYLTEVPNVSDIKESEATGEWQEQWAGSASLEEAFGYAYRWDEGVNDIKRINERLNVGVAKFVKESRYVHTVPGSYNMSRIAQGHPRPVVRKFDTDQTRRGQGKIVSVIINVSASSGVSAENMRRRGAAALALVQALEKQGRRSEITVVMKTGRGKTYTGEYRVTVKRPNEVLNLPSIAFACAHPSMLRRLIFAAMERENEDQRKHIVHSAYGMPMDTDDEKRKDTIYLPAMTWGDSEWKSDKAALDYVMDRLREQGVVLN